MPLHDGSNRYMVAMPPTVTWWHRMSMTWEGYTDRTWETESAFVDPAPHNSRLPTPTQYVRAGHSTATRVNLKSRSCCDPCGHGYRKAVP